MQTGVLRAQILDFQGLDGLDGRLSHQMHALSAGVGQILQGVEQGGGGAAHKFGGLAVHQRAVVELDGHGGFAGGLGQGIGPVDGGAQLVGGAGLAHEQLQLIDGVVAALAVAALAQGGIVAADDLLTGGGLTGLVVKDAFARHVHTHIGGGLIGALAGDMLKDGAQNGEDLHVPVVVDGGLAVGLEMEGVDHVHVVQIGGGGLVCQIDGVLQGQVPDGEGLKLGVAGHDAPLMLMIELGQAGGHLAAAGAGGGEHHQGTGGLHIVVAAEALVADDFRDVMGIALDAVVAVDLDAQLLQAGLEGVGGGLAGVLGDHDAAHIQAAGAENVDQAQYVHVIGDAQIAAHLVFLDVGGVDDDDDLRVVLELLQHPDLAVGGEAGQHPGGVIVVKQLSAKLQIQLAAELRNAVLNVLRLHLQIFVVVKSAFHHGEAPLYVTLTLRYFTPESKTPSRISRRFFRPFEHRKNVRFPLDKIERLLYSLCRTFVLGKNCRIREIYGTDSLLYSAQLKEAEGIPCRPSIPPVTALGCGITSST